MSEKSKRIVTICTLILIFIISSIFILVVILRNLLNENRIKSMVLTSLERAMPNSIIKTDNFKINFGWNFKIKIDNLSLFQGNSDPILSIKNLKIYLPFYTIWHKNPDTNLEAEAIEFRISDPSSKLKPFLPHKIYRNNSPFNHFLQKFKNYGDQLLNNSSFTMKTDKLLIINEFLTDLPKKIPCRKIKIDLKNLATPLYLSLRCNLDKNFSGTISLKGKFNLSELIARSELLFSGSFTLENTNHSIIGNIPPFRGKINNLHINHEHISIPIEASSENWGKGSFIFSHGQKKTSLNSIKWELNAKKLSSYKNLPSMVGAISIQGNLDFSNQGISPRIFFKGQRLQAIIKKIKIPFLVSGSIIEHTYKLNTEIKVFKGKINSLISGQIKKDFNLGLINIKSVISSLELNPAQGKSSFQEINFPFPQVPIRANVKFDKITYSQFPLKGKAEILVDYSKTKMNVNLFSKKSSINLKLKLNNSTKEVNLNFLLYNLELGFLQLIFPAQKNLLQKIAGLEIKGNGSFQTDKKRKNLEMNLILGNSTAKMAVKSSESKKNDYIDLSLKAFDLSLLKNIMPQEYGLFQGILNLNFQGFFPYPVQKNNDLLFKIDLAAYNGVYNNPYLGPKWEKFIKENKGLEKYISKNASPHIEFDNIFFVGDVKDERINIKNFDFQAPEKKLLVQANGSLGLNESIKSTIYIKMADSKGIITPQVNKLLGMETLFIKLEGQGLKVKPNLFYTSSKLLENTAKDLPKKLLSPLDFLIIDPLKKGLKIEKNKP